MLLQDHDVGLGVSGSVVDLLSDLFDNARNTKCRAMLSANAWRSRKHAWTHLPIRNILHDLLLSSERGGVPSVGISVLLGKDEGDEVDSRPGGFPLELSVTRQADGSQSV